MNGRTLRHPEELHNIILEGIIELQDILETLT